MKPKLKGSEIRRLRRVAEEMHEPDKDYRRASNYDFFLYLLLVFFVAFSVRTFIGEPIRVDGNSMYPTLHDGERMVVEKITYLTQQPRRGDIIVCYYPGYTVSCVKRVIGVPGDYVYIEDGDVYVNNVKLEEDYIPEDIYGVMQERVIKQGTVFVMGDNRNHSSDSRDPDVGDIPYEKIVGRAILVAWPIDSFRTLERVDYPGVGSRPLEFW